MQKYIKKIEQLVEQKLSEKSRVEKKGFAAPKNTPKEEKKQQDIYDFVASFVADIRKQRMEMKNGN
jgi:protein tyrosine phosphatase